MADPMIMAPGWDDMAKYAQNIPTECWLMCYKMMYSYKNWDESSIEGKLAAVGIDVTSARNKTGLLTKYYMTAAKALGLRAKGAGQSWSTYDFRSMLPLGPIWVAGRWVADSSHNVVVIGASETKIRFIDPWNDVMRVAEDRTWDSDTFIKGDGGKAPGTDFYMGRIGAVASFG